VATNQRRQLAAREERELCTLGRELRVGVSAKSQRQANDIAVERDRSIEIAHEQDRVAKTGRHANMFAPQLQDALADELVAAPGHRPSAPKRVALPSETTEQPRLLLVTRYFMVRVAERLRDGRRPARS
jgi:hypothetical protein